MVGRELAKKFGVFHISFKDRLQELIIAKTKKRIGPDYPEEEPEGDENEAEESGNSEKEGKEKSENGMPYFYSVSIGNEGKLKNC